MTLLLLLVACKNPVTLTPGQDACVSEDPEAAAEEVVWESTGEGAARVGREVVLDGTGLVFDPVFEVEPNVVHVYERWSGGGTEDPFCYAPNVAIEGIARELQVRWYLAEGDTTPFDTVDIEAE